MHRKSMENAQNGAKYNGARLGLGWGWVGAGLGLGWGCAGAGLGHKVRAMLACL